MAQAFPLQNFGSFLISGGADQILWTRILWTPRLFWYVLEQSLGKRMRRSRHQWRKAPFHWKRVMHSVNEGQGHSMNHRTLRIEFFCVHPLLKSQLLTLYWDLTIREQHRNAGDRQSLLTSQFESGSWCCNTSLKNLIKEETRSACTSETCRGATDLVHFVLRAKDMIPMKHECLASIAVLWTLPTSSWVRKGQNSLVILKLPWSKRTYRGNKGKEANSYHCGGKKDTLSIPNHFQHVTSI